MALVSCRHCAAAVITALMPGASWLVDAAIHHHERSDGTGYPDGLREAQSAPLTRLLAVCDVYDGRLARAKEVWGNQLFTTRDYREVLARKDVDAVIIATPDHWHSRITIAVLYAGSLEAADAQWSKEVLLRAAQTPEHLTRALDILGRVGAELGVTGVALS